jgi:two-component system OmpR family sensor kinase
MTLPVLPPDMPEGTPPPGPGAVLTDVQAHWGAMQAANAQLQRQLAATQAELEDFTFSVSHDLRASLRHITAYAGLVREDLGEQLPAGVAAHLDTLSQAAQHMGRMINSLTELSRLGGAELHQNQVVISGLINDVRTELSGDAVARQIAWQVADDFPLVRGDADLIRQLWRHVLSNALKFTRSRTSAQIQIGWQSPPGASAAPCVQFFVQDNGVGFNPRYANKLFHAFQRLHSTHEFEGLGMGLALSRKIVERHGGAISALGEVDAGCRISFTLPLAGPALPSAGA